MSADAWQGGDIPLSDADMETLEKNLQKAPKTVKRNLVGGPLDGKQVLIPETQLVNDVGWFTMHYTLRENGTMGWGRKE